MLTLAQACAVVGALGLALAVPASFDTGDLGLGALAGALNVAGLGLLYQALARYPAATVAPITAVVGSMVPVTWGLATGERPSGLVLLGVGAAVVAAGLLGREPGDVSDRRVARGVLPAAAAGVLLGSSLVLFSETSEDSGQWPVLAARVTAFVGVGLVALVLWRRSSIRVPQGSARRLAIAAGVLDVAATGLLVVAVRREYVSVVAPIASLAPGFTVLLAWAIAEDRPGRTQLAGLGLAVAGLACIAAG